MDIRAFKDGLLKAAKDGGITDIELFYLSYGSSDISVYKGDIESLKGSSHGGVGIRGLYNGVMGYYYSEILDNKDIPKIIDAIKQNAEVIDSEDKEFIFEGSKEYAKVQVYNEELNSLTVEDKTAAALKMERAALAYDSRVESVSKAMVALGENKCYIANSKGLELSEKNNYILAYAEVIAREGESTKEKGELWIGKGLEGFNPEAIGQKAAKKAVEALGGSPVPSGVRNVIIKNDVMAEILGCFSGCFFAENVQKGFSLLKDKLNTKIAADMVTIADEPLLEGGYATTAFDSEGVASYNKLVVEKGVLKTYLYNLKSAHRDGVKSTGNGFKSSFKGAVATGVTNFYIKPGDKSLEALVAELGEGLIITDVSGLHSGANSITGDFSLGAEGFLVEKGRVVRAVEQITVASNFYSLIKNIKALGDDLYFSGTGSPSAIVSDISVSGE